MSSLNILVDSVAAMLCAEELSTPWAQVPDTRRAVYRVRARKQLTMIANRLEQDGWVMLPQKLSEEEALEVAMRNVLAAPRAMKEGEEFVLSPQIVQIVHTSIVAQASAFNEPPAPAASAKS